jgi:DMSO/TMAO reductase YedYZ heme-binding membrane subunit
MNLSWIQSEAHQKLIERWWIAIVLVWGILRSILVDKTFAKYGVNPWVYFAIVIAISVPYAICSAKLVFALVEKHWQNSARWGVLTVILHYIPDTYILTTAKSVPRSLFDSFIFAIVIFTLFGIREVVKRIKSHNKEI